MSSYTLFELNEYIKRVIALNFQEPVWIECEISQVKESRGNFYLDFVQKKEDSDEVVAQSSGYLWYKSALFLKKKLGDLFAALLKDGTAVKIKVYIEFHERYGLKLNIEDIVIWKDVVEESLLIQYMKACDICIVPSLGE